MQVTSTLVSIAPLVWKAESAEQARSILIDHLSGTKVKDRDKMISDIKQLSTLAEIHRYTANSLLKYEGLGL